MQYLLTIRVTALKGRFVKMLPYLSNPRDIGKVLELRFVFQPETEADRGMSIVIAWFKCTLKIY